MTDQTLSLEAAPRISFEMLGARYPLHEEAVNTAATDTLVSATDVAERTFITADGPAVLKTPAETGDTGIEQKEPGEEAIASTLEALETPTQKSPNRRWASRVGKITAVLAGSLALSAAAAPAAAARYNYMGPALNGGNVQQNLDFQLDKNGCSAFKHRLAKVMGLHTKEAIDKYLTGANVDAGKQFTARNSGKNAWKGNSAANGCVSVPLKNGHKSSVAYKILLNEIPPSLSYKFKQLDNGKFELKNASIRGLCTNVLSRKVPKGAKKQKPTPNFNMDFSEAIAKDLAIAAAVAESEATQEVTVRCENGTTVSSRNYAHARSDALALAAANTSRPGTVVFVGSRGNSYASAMASYSSRYNELLVAAGATARTQVEQQLRVDCGTPPPNPCPPGSIKPECNPPIANKPPTTEIDNPNHVGTNDVIAVCERENDPDDAPGVNTIPSRVFRIVSGGGNFVSDVYAGNDPKEFCRDYRGPSTDTATSGTKVTLAVTVTDKDGASAEAVTAPFPVQTLPV